MNVFIDLHYLKNLKKGFGQYCLNLGNGLTSQPLHEVNLTYYCPIYFRKKFGNKVSYKNAYDHHRYFDFKKEYDIWHNTTHLSKIKPGPTNHSKVITTIHDTIFTLFNFPAHEVQQKCEQLQSKIDKSSGLIYISEFTKKSVQERFNIPSHTREYVIHNGNPLENAKPIIQKSAHQPYLLSVGEFRSYKNQKALIPMLSHLKNDLKLIFIGKHSKNSKKEILELAQHFKVSHRVEIKGLVDKNQKIELYSNASALVHPSLAEGFGFPIVEAMSFGVPVISSNKTSLPEVGGTLASYWEHFEPEYMAELVMKTIHEYQINSVESKQKLIEHSKKFFWEQAAKRYLDVYKEIAEG